MQPETLRDTRAALGKIKDVAERIGVHSDTLGRIERGIKGYPVTRTTALAVGMLDMLDQLETMAAFEREMIAGYEADGNVDGTSIFLELARDRLARLEKTIADARSKYDLPE